MSTRSVLGIRANPDGHAAPAQELYDAPGFADQWFDLSTKSVTTN